MKTYLKQLPNKSPEHKRRFALLVSGGFTLLVFSVWSLVTFGEKSEVVVDDTGPVNLAAVSESQAAPFRNIFRGIKDSWASLREMTSNGN